MPHYNGPDYDPELDQVRLQKQTQRVFDVMVEAFKFSRWVTLDELAEYAACPAASASAQLRHLRKPRFGGHVVRKQRRGRKEHGLFEYMLIPNPNSKVWENIDGRVFGNCGNE